MYSFLPVVFSSPSLQIHTSRMTLADDVNLEEFVMTKDEFSGADIKAICTEAGLLALRERRMKVSVKNISDFVSLSVCMRSINFEEDGSCSVPSFYFC